MAINDLTFEQISSVLNSIYQQATGDTAIAITSTSDFVTVAQTALKAGYDPVMQAISQVLSDTIFSVRPYYEKFQGLRVNTHKWGNVVRKLNIVDQPFVNNESYSLTDGQSIDQYIVRKAEVLQTNFYGMTTVSDFTTIFMDQLDNAMRGPEELADFFSMQIQNISDKHAQSRESLARACVANFIGGKISGDASSVIHLLTEYNAVTGLSLTGQTVYQPTNFAPFMQWVYGRVATLSSMMTERSKKFHINVTGKEISRHTPYERQKVFLFAPEQFQMNARVLADAFHDNFLRYAANETVNYWQSIESPDAINVLPSYMDNTGAIVQPQSAVSQAKIFGLIIDEEAAGYTIMHERMLASPPDARGQYYNLFWHFDRRYWNDFTENGIVLLLD